MQRLRDFSGSASSLGSLDNAVSNIEVASGVTVYRNRDFGGVSQTFRPGNWGSSALTVVGNDTISSLVVGLACRLGSAARTAAGATVKRTPARCRP